MMRIHSVQAIAHIQDLGRFGLRRFGIGHAGAMDTLALQAAFERLSTSSPMR